MARVHSAKKNNAGKELRCGRMQCGEVIVPGERYFYWEPRYGPKGVRCFRHAPRQSETTTSKMSEVYAAVEESEDWAQSYDGMESGDYSAKCSEVYEVVEQVKSEYEEAAEQFGGAGANQERAEELESFIYELESVEFEDFNDWWGSNCPDDGEEAAGNAWREDMASRLSEVMGNVP